MFVVNSYDFRLENLLLDQIIIPLLVLVFIRIIFILEREILSWSLMGVES